MNRNLFLQLLFAPDPPSGTGEAADTGLSDDAQDLADLDGSPDAEADDAEAEAEPDAEEGEEVDEEDADGESEESEEVEDAEEGEEGEKDKEVEKGVPAIKAIKAKYPNLFKDFPQLRSAFFLAPKFLEVFPDPESARTASIKAEEYDVLESTLVGKGDPKTLLTTIHENNPKAFGKIVENLVSTVRELDQNAYSALATPILEEMLYFAAQHGDKTGNKNLKIAAQHIANYIWANGGEIPDVRSRLSAKKEPSDAEKQLEEERAGYAREKFQSAAVDIAKTVDTEINTFISIKLDGLTSFEKKQVVKEVRVGVEKALQTDEGLQRTLKTLWKRAGESGYSDESKSRIRRAWLDRAKAVAPGIRNRLRQEALDARTGKGTQDDKGKKRTFPNSGGKGRASSSGVLDPKKIDWKKTSDLDLLK